MSTKMKENASIETAVDVVDSISAALESDPATQTLAPPWAAMRETADGLAQTGRKLDRDALRARSRLTVQDSQWDTTVAAFGRAAVDASGGRREQPPYTRFVAKITPSAAQDFGIGREIVNRELDRLEGDLKKLFPGNPDRVASYLAATRNNRHTDAPDPPAPPPTPAAK